jgi:hypothetical protein
MRTQTKASKQSTPDAPALTFRQNVIYRDEENDGSVFLEAGKPSPWFHESEVPERFRGLIGVPNFDPPPNTPNQYWVPKAQLEAERQALEALNSNDEMSDSLREELEWRDRQYLRDAESRNRTESAILDREAEDRRRLIAELEKEAAAKLKGYKS